MIPPINLNNEIANLATAQNREGNPELENPGLPNAAPAETAQATNPSEPGAGSNNEQGFGTAAQRLEEAQNREPVGPTLNSSEEAQTAVQRILEEMQGSPTAAMQAQGMQNTPEFVSQMLAA